MDEPGQDDGLFVGRAGGNVTPWIHATKGVTKGSYKGEYVDALGKWFEGLSDWNWFITRSLNNRVDEGFTEAGIGTARHCLRDLLLRTEAESFVCVFERQERGVPHLHALLRAGRAISGRVEQERDFQLHGISRWKIYHKGKGAAYYVGKYLGKEMIELYIGLDGPYTKRELAGKRLFKLRC